MKITRTVSLLLALAFLTATAEAMERCEKELVKN